MSARVIVARNEGSEVSLGGATRVISWIDSDGVCRGVARNWAHRPVWSWQAPPRPSEPQEAAYTEGISCSPDAASAIEQVESRLEGAGYELAYKNVGWPVWNESILFADGFEFKSASSIGDFKPKEVKVTAHIARDGVIEPPEKEYPRPEVVALQERIDCLEAERARGAASLAEVAKLAECYETTAIDLDAASGVMRKLIEENNLRASIYRGCAEAIREKLNTEEGEE